MTTTTNTKSTRMQVRDEDWKAVRIAAVEAGIPAQDHAGTLLQRLAANPVESDPQEPLDGRRRAVWVRVPLETQRALEGLKTRGFSWAKLLGLAVDLERSATS